MKYDYLHAKKISKAIIKLGECLEKMGVSIKNENETGVKFLRYE